MDGAVIFVMVITLQGVFGQTGYYDYNTMPDYPVTTVEPEPIRPVKSRQGRVCRSHDHCGPNEVCRKSPRFEPGSYGVCECRRCYGYNSKVAQCVRLTIRYKVCSRSVSFRMLSQTPSNTTTSPTTTSMMTTTDFPLTTEDDNGTNITTTMVYTPETCDNTCTPFSLHELYPPNSQCMSDGRLVCNKCYEASYGNEECLALPTTAANLNHGNYCRSECDCKSDLKCLPTCGCPTGKRWDNQSKSCVDDVVTISFGGACQSDEQCHYSDSSKQIVQYAPKIFAKCTFVLAPSDYYYDSYYDETTTMFPMTTQGFNETDDGNSTSVNATGRCNCGPGSVQEYFSYIDMKTTWMTERIVCLGVSSTKVEKGEICNSDPIAETEVSNKSLICSSPAGCYQCPEGFRQNNLGRCRSKTMLTEVQQYHNKKVPWTQWTGKICSKNRDCEMRNEVCLKAPVDPPCNQGYCACRPGTEYAADGHCRALVNLGLGDPCNGTKNEIYQTNSYCFANFSRTGGRVACKNQYRLEGSNCVLDTFKYVGHGYICNDNCQSGLICGVDRKQSCQCPLTTHYWDETQGRCRKRLLGDVCETDADCDVSDPPRKSKPAGRVCLLRSQGGKKCSCDKRFDASDCYAPRRYDLFEKWRDFGAARTDDYYWLRNTREHFLFCSDYINQNKSSDDYFEIHAGVTPRDTDRLRRPYEEGFFFGSVTENNVEVIDLAMSQKISSPFILISTLFFTLLILQYQSSC